MTILKLMQSKSIQQLPLYGACLISLGYFCTITVLCNIMYACFFYDADLAWSAHLLAWNSEKWPLYSIMNGTWLGDHFDPIGIILLPFFTMFPSVWTLLIFQNLAFASIPLLSFFLAQKILKSSRWGLVISLLSILNPAIWYINLYDFHWVVLTIPLTLAYFLALEYRKSTQALICLGVMLFCKEHTALLVIPLSIAHYVYFKDCKLFLSTIIVSILFFIGVNVWLIPALGIQAPLYRWTYLGSNVPEIIWGVLTQPALVIEHLFIQDNAKYLLDLLMPWLFLSLLNWRVLLPAGIFIIFGLSTDPLLRTIQFQNASMLLACVQVSAIFGLAWILRRLQTIQWPRTSQVVVCLLLIGVSGYNFFHRSPQREGTVYMHQKLTHEGLSLLWNNEKICPNAPLLKALIEKIPQNPDVAVIAFRPVAPHLVAHPRLHLFDRGEIYKQNHYLDFDYIVGNAFFGWYRSGKEYRDFLRSLVYHPQWEVIHMDKLNNFVLKKVTK